MAKSKGRDPADINKDVLTVEQAAAYLNISRSTLFKLLEYPDSGISNAGGKILGQWRFSRRKLLEWLEAGGYSPPDIKSRGGAMKKASPRKKK